MQVELSKMDKQIMKVIVMTVFSVASAFGQSQAEIEARFGQPVSAYVVSERIWMSPEYASDGQVCRMIFYPRRFSSTTNYLRTERSTDAPRRSTRSRK